MSQDPEINRLSSSFDGMTAAQRELIAAVKHDSELRMAKIHSIEETNKRIEVTNSRIGKALYAIAAMFLLLLILAVVNAFNLQSAAQTARDANQTNTLLVSCFTPGSDCQKQSQANQKQQLDQIRVTQFVIATCQRENPMSDDPKGVQMRKCINNVYPDLKLPEGFGR